MANFIDVDFANRSSSRLDRYKIVNTNPFKANFRCPFCLDSKKSKSKARGWLLESDNKLHFYCHNCFASMSFQKYLKELDHSLYNDYVAEKFIANNDTEKKFAFNRPKPGSVVPSNSFIMVDNGVKVEETEIIKQEDSRLMGLSKLVDLPDDHPAKQYIASRQMPLKSFEKLYYAPKFLKWVNSVLPNKFNEDTLKREEPRILLPFCDETGVMFGFTGRSFDPESQLRYLTIMLDPTKDKFYGLDNVDFSKKYYITEGGLDSLFLDNACAMSGADAKIENLKNNYNCVLVYDNEPRNAEIHKKMEEAFDVGYSVVIWPDTITEKDINNMILYQNMTAEEVQEIVESNTYKGLKGKLQFNKWKRV